MYIIATLDHRGLYNAVCEESADWSDSKEVKIMKDAANQNVEAGRQVMQAIRPALYIY